MNRNYNNLTLQGKSCILHESIFTSTFTLKGKVCWAECCFLSPQGSFWDTLLPFPHTVSSAPPPGALGAGGDLGLELTTKFSQCLEKDPSRAFSLLKAPSRGFLYFFRRQLDLVSAAGDGEDAGPAPVWPDTVPITHHLQYSPVQCNTVMYS